MVVYGVEKPNVSMLMHEKRDLDCMYLSKSFDFLQSLHLISTISGVASFRITLRPDFDC